jgi:hypothetical protein
VEGSVVLDPPGFLALTVLAFAAVFAVRFIVFRVSCTLAEAGEPGAGRSILLVTFALVITVGCAFIAGYVFPAATADAGAGPMVVKGAAAVVGAAVAAVFYSLFLPTTLRRGAIVAGTELLLGALLASLVAGLVLVALAAFQLKARPEPRQSSAFTSPVNRGPVA